MKILFIVFLICWTTRLDAQKRVGSIKGTVMDSVQNMPVEGATVSIVKAKDSSLVDYCITGEQGHFSVSRLLPGDYRLLIGHVNYTPSSTSFTIANEVTALDFKTILLFQKTNVLEEVEIKSETPPVVLKGDTTEFNAGSFKTRPNAAVEELLKRLPGMNVEKDGTIKLNGQKINHVLVDGRKFFGGNPKTATQNLPADAIDKIQVFDKLSDQAQLSGFDDGKSSKTLNLTFKKDHKKGSFGKLNAAHGTAGRYTVKANINKFTEGMQLTTLASSNNINDDITSIGDISDFSTLQNKNTKNGQNTIRLTAENSIITAAGVGVNYNNFTGTNRDIHGDYLYNHASPVSESQTTRTFFLPGKSWTYAQQQQAWNITNAHAANAVYEKRFTANESLKITGSANWQHQRSFSEKQYRTNEENGTMTNEGLNNNRNNSKLLNGRADLIYRKRFLRAGRTFSIFLSVESMDLAGTAQQLSENHFYTSGQLSSHDTIDQQSKLNSGQTNYTIRSVFTESVFKTSLLEFSAGTSFSGTNATTEVYDFDPVSGKYALPDAALSNHFKNAYTYQNAGFRLRTQTYKAMFSIGISSQWSALNSEVLAAGKPILKKTFYDMLPNAGFKYSFSRYRDVNLTYTTSINAPSSYQLQPLLDISDPLNIHQGNPNLNREYNHQIQLLFRSRHPYNGNSLVINMAAASMSGTIVSSDSINNMGVKKSMPVNVNGNYYILLNLDAGFKMSWLKSYISVGLYSTLYKSKMLINGHENNITNFAMGPQWKMTVNPSENTNLLLFATFSFTQSSYSIQPSANNDFITQHYGIDFSWQLPGKIFIATDFSYTINKGLTNGYNINIPLLNASVSRFILNNNRGEIRLGVTDAFNRNTKVTRKANQNYIEDTHTAVLTQYFSLGFIYSLSRVGLSSPGSSRSNLFKK